MSTEVFAALFLQPSCDQTLLRLDPGNELLKALLDAPQVFTHPLNSLTSKLLHLDLPDCPLLLLSLLSVQRMI